MKKPSLLLCALIALFPYSVYAQSGLCESFTVENNELRIPVTINGNQYQAGLTTSNIGVSMSSSMAGTLGLVVRTNGDLRIVETFGRAEFFRYVDDVDLTLFGNTIHADDVAIVEADEEWLTLSLRVFKGLITQINFPGKELCLFPRAAIDLQEAKNIIFDSDPQYGSPMLKLKLNDEIDAWLALSPTYSGGIIVDPYLASQLNLHSQLDAVESQSENTLRTSIDQLQIGPYTLGNITAEFPKPGVRDNLTTQGRVPTGTNIREGRGFRGRVGIDVLKHFVLTMDLERQQLHIYAPN
ncbi:MAG: hypothetical protein CMQ46_02685 [Gammaproteobacteria bacterium]|nr:hypothetical protein [Gammaproteobacteria bacterium]MBJ54155.1 hypothetical protein [Gammaproteobacteria bacterium]|tara:strand:+ start:522 stop:1412 length:891 start_codon:yes stop_codon:yes gene_type:complete